MKLEAIYNPEPVWCANAHHTQFLRKWPSVSLCSYGSTPPINTPLPYVYVPSVSYGAADLLMGHLAGIRLYFDFTWTTTTWCRLPRMHRDSRALHLGCLGVWSTSALGRVGSWLERSNLHYYIQILSTKLSSSSVIRLSKLCLINWLHVAV